MKKRIGLKIAEELVLKNLSKSRASFIAGIERHQLDSILTGGSNYTIGTLESLLKALDLDLTLTENLF